MCRINEVSFIHLKSYLTLYALSNIENKKTILKCQCVNISKFNKKIYIHSINTWIMSIAYDWNLKWHYLINSFLKKKKYPCSSERIEHLLLLLLSSYIFTDVNWIDCIYTTGEHQSTLGAFILTAFSFHFAIYQSSAAEFFKSDWTSAGVVNSVIYYIHMHCISMYCTVLNACPDISVFNAFPLQHFHIIYVCAKIS